MRVQPHVDAVLVEQVPTRRQPPHRLAALHVLQAHRAQAQRAGPGLAGAALGVDGGALVRERRRHEHVDGRRATERAAGVAGPAQRRHDDPAGGACVVTLRGAHGVSPGSVGYQPPDDAKEHHGEAGDGAGLDNPGGGRENAEQEQRHAGHDDAVAGAALDVVVIAAAAGAGRARGGEHNRGGTAHYEYCAVAVSSLRKDDRLLPWVYGG